MINGLFLFSACNFAFWTQQLRRRISLGIFHNLIRWIINILFTFLHFFHSYAPMNSWIQPNKWICFWTVFHVFKIKMMPNIEIVFRASFSLIFAHFLSTRKPMWIDFYSFKFHRTKKNLKSFVATSVNQTAKEKYSRSIKVKTR